MYRTLLKIITCLFFFSFVFAATSHAVQYELEMNVNHETFEGALTYSTPLDNNNFNARFNYIYKEDKYKKGSGELLLSNQVLDDKLTFNLGFNSIYGEIMDLHKDPKISNVGFVFGLEYTLPDHNLPIPVVLANKASLAPEPICFENTKSHFQYRANLDFKILNNAGITMGYRYFRTNFENGFEKDDYSEQSVFIGYKLTFGVK